MDFSKPIPCIIDRDKIKEDLERKTSQKFGHRDEGEPLGPSFEWYLHLLEKYKSRLSDTVMIWQDGLGVLPLCTELVRLGYKAIPSIIFRHDTSLFQGEATVLRDYIDAISRISSNVIPYIHIGTTMDWGVEVNQKKVNVTREQWLQFSDSIKERAVFAPVDVLLSWEGYHDTKGGYFDFFDELGNPVFCYEGYWAIYDSREEMFTALQRPKISSATYKRGWSKVEGFREKYCAFLRNYPVPVVSGMGYREGARIHHFNRLQDAGYTGALFHLPPVPEVGDGDEPYKYMEDILTDVT